MKKSYPIIIFVLLTVIVVGVIVLTQDSKQGTVSHEESPNAQAVPDDSFVQPAVGSPSETTSNITAPAEVQVYKPNPKSYKRDMSPIELVSEFSPETQEYLDAGGGFIRPYVVEGMQRALEAGPELFGRYSLHSYGCGTGCVAGTFILDHTDGHLYTSPHYSLGQPDNESTLFTASVWKTGGEFGTPMVNGWPNPGDPVRTIYFDHNGYIFRPIASYDCFHGGPHAPKTGCQESSFDDIEPFALFRADDREEKTMVVRVPKAVQNGGDFESSKHIGCGFEIEFEEYVVPFTIETLDATYRIMSSAGTWGWKYDVVSVDEDAIATVEVRTGGIAGICAIPAATYVPPAAALQYPSISKVRFVDQDGQTLNGAGLFGAADNPPFEPWEFTKEEMAPFLGIDI